MISVVIPVLNQIYYTDLLFQDIMKNEVKPTQILLIDDGSTDDYSKLVDKYNCLNINYIKNRENMGVNAVWNMGIRLSTYPIVTILNNDILINRFFFKKTIEVMQNPLIGICVPNTIANKEFLDKDEEPITIPKTNKDWGHAFTMRKSVISRYGYIPDILKIWGGDNYLFFISEKTGFINVKIINNNIFHFGSTTVKTIEKTVRKNDIKNWTNILEKLNGGGQ